MASPVPVSGDAPAAATGSRAATSGVDGSALEENKNMDSLDGTSTFACPAHLACALVDFRALCYLEEFLAEMATRQPGGRAHTLVPLRTAANGNCLTNAVSLAIFGSEEHSESLRTQMAAEIEQNKSWYAEKLEFAHPGAGEKELAEAVQRAQTPGAFLTTAHMVALANVLQRPVILVASRENMRRFGMGYHGIAGTFLPIRFFEQQLLSGEGLGDEQKQALVREHLGKQRPVVVAWGSEAKDHFVPLTNIVFEEDKEANNKRAIGFPVPAPTEPVHDPFSPPVIPAAWIDFLCRSCGDGVYCGCWERHPQTFIGPGASPTTAARVQRQCALVASQFAREIIEQDVFARADRKYTNGLTGVEPAVDILLLLKHSLGHDPGIYVPILETLSKMIKNLVDQPDEAKFRRINLDNAALHQKLGRYLATIELFLALGFQYEAPDSNFLILPKHRENAEVNARVTGTIGSMLAQFGKDVLVSK
ncbi:unnamed protein product [Amoebophrya sp. A25]|nr:unnamed protein product [Amoebophrya sp. A25]|eukprot:GSA25T00013779001.1